MALVNVLDQALFRGWTIWEYLARLIPADEAALMLSDMFYECYFYKQEKQENFPSSLFLLAPHLQLFFLEEWSRKGWEKPKEQISCTTQRALLLHFLAAQLASVRQQGHTSVLADPWLEQCIDEWYRLFEQAMISRRDLFELGRAKILYEELWHKETGEFALGSDNHLSVDSLWLLVLSLLAERGYVREWQLMMTNMRFSKEEADDLVTKCTTRAEEVLSLRCYLEYPEKFWSPFLHAPILRLPNRSLFAPEPLRVTNAFEYYVSHNADKRYASEGRTREFSRVFGKVFEKYIGMLLRTFEEGPELSLWDEFRYCRRKKEEVDSPDFFFHRGGQNQKTLVFECKSARYLEPDPAEKINLAAFQRWVGKLLGETNKRGIFEQGC